MEADLHLDVPLYVAGPLVLLCLLLAAYLSAAETAITGASRQRINRALRVLGGAGLVKVKVDL